MPIHISVVWDFCFFLISSVGKKENPQNMEEEWGKDAGRVPKTTVFFHFYLEALMATFESGLAYFYRPAFLQHISQKLVLGLLLERGCIPLSQTVGKNKFFSKRFILHFNPLKTLRSSMVKWQTSLILHFPNVPNHQVCLFR